MLHRPLSLLIAGRSLRKSAQRTIPCSSIMQRRLFHRSHLLKSSERDAIQRQETAGITGGPRNATQYRYNEDKPHSFLQHVDGVLVWRKTYLMEPNGHVLVGARNMDVEVLGRGYAAMDRHHGDADESEGLSIDVADAGITEASTSIDQGDSTAADRDDAHTEQHDGKLEVTVEAYAYNCDEETLEDIDRSPLGFMSQFYHEDFHRPLTNTLRVFFPRAPPPDVRTRFNMSQRQIGWKFKQYHPPFIVLRVVTPRHFHVEVETDIGDIGVCGIHGRISLRSELGNILVEDVAGSYCTMEHRYGDIVADKVYSERCSARVEEGRITFNEVSSDVKIWGNCAAVDVDKLVGGRLKIEVADHHPDKVNVYVHRPGIPIHIHSVETAVRIFFRTDEFGDLLTGKYRINARSFGGIYIDDEIEPRGIVKSHIMNGIIGPVEYDVRDIIGETADHDQQQGRQEQEEKEDLELLNEQHGSALSQTKANSPLGQITVKIESNYPLFFHVFHEKLTPLGETWEKLSPHYEWARNPGLFRWLIALTVFMWLLAYRRINRYLKADRERNERQMMEENKERENMIAKPLKVE